MSTLPDVVRAAETAHPDWRSGDVAIVDNLSVAHGREPFGGPRQVFVTMTAPMHSTFTGSVHV